MVDIHWRAPSRVQSSPEAQNGDTELADESGAWNVEVHIKRQGRPKGTAASVYAPRFPKVSCISLSSRLAAYFHGPFGTLDDFRACA